MNQHEYARVRTPTSAHSLTKAVHTHMFSGGAIRKKSGQTTSQCSQRYAHMPPPQCTPAHTHSQPSSTCLCMHALTCAYGVGKVVCFCRHMQRSERMARNRSPAATWLRLSICTTSMLGIISASVHQCRRAPVGCARIWPLSQRFSRREKHENHAHDSIRMPWRTYKLMLHAKILVADEKP